MAQTANTNSHLDLWGKTSPGGGFHPLACHMLDAAAVAKSLLEASASRRRVAMKLLSLPGADYLTHVPYWTSLHDLGKATPCFQQIAEEQRVRLLARGWNFPAASRIKIPHASLTGGMLRKGYGLHAPSLEGAWRSQVAVALSGHHGVFDVSENRTAMGATDAQWFGRQSDIVSEVHRIIGPSTLYAWPDGDAVHPAGWAWLAGFVTLADWIASNTDWFPLLDSHAELDLVAYYTDRCRMAAVVVRDHGFGEPGVAAAPSSFEAMFKRTARPLQRVVEQMHSRSDPTSTPRLIIVESPMGEGKTEAALYAAAAGDGGLAAGLYVGLPTQATSNQMFGRVETFLRGQAREALQLGLLHGLSSLNHDYRRLAAATVNREPGETLIAEEWFTGAKRGLLSPFAVGTIDQSLMSVLQVRHHCLRGMALAGKTIVIDEVHAYDIYTSTLIDRLLQWLCSMNSRVVLLSATLPQRRVRELVGRFGGTCQTLASYPRVTAVGPLGTQSVPIPVPPDARRKSIRVECVQETEEQTASWLSRAVADGGCAVWIRNTVGDAQAAYSTLRATDPALEVMLFHARFRAGERATIERQCLNAFGPVGSRPVRRVLIATQVVEQSLDLDFDLMVSDHAPIDLLLQRSGRLHRHDRSRPTGMDAPVLRIRLPVATANDNVPTFGASEWVYQRLVLLRSMLAVRATTLLRIPEDIEPLVESVYGDTPITSDDPDWREAILVAVAEASAEAKAAELRARSVCIAPPMTWDPLDGSKQLEEDDPGVHQSLQASTRDASPSVRLVFLFGRPDGTLSDFPDGSPIDLHDTSPQAVERLLAAAISVQNQRVIQGASQLALPPAWSNRAVLRYLRLAPLSWNSGAWTLDLGQSILELDPHLGLVIKTKSPALENELEAST